MAIALNNSGTVPDGTISNAKLATMAANTVKVRAASSTGAPSDLALSASTILGRGSSGDIAALTIDDTLILTGTVLGTNPLVLAPPTAANSFTVPANFATYPASTHALTGGRMYALPHFQANTDTATKIAIHVTTNHASNARLGIYADNGGVPGERLLDAGTVSLATTGLKTITITYELTPGKYWIVILPQSNGASVEGVANADINPSVLGIDNGGSGASPVPYLYRTFAYAALPDPFGSATRGGTGAPWIGLSFA